MKKQSKQTALSHHLLQKPFAEWAVLTVALILLGPVIYYWFPFHQFSPDIMYVKAKSLSVAAGDLFADPITGIKTMHPPYFHLVPACLGMLNLSTSTALIGVTVFNVLLILFLAFKCLETAFDRTTALFTCLMFPFIIDYMGCGGILLATAFFFSVPFYLAGLWLFLQDRNSPKLWSAISIFWGIAFLVSPVYLFLILATFVYLAAVQKKYRQFLIMAGVFALCSVPFVIQYLIVAAQNFGSAKTFAFWRGIPDWSWIKNLGIDYIAPNAPVPMVAPPVVHAAIILAAALAIFKTKQIKWYIPIALFAYLLTYYHFSPQYAIRIQLFLSLFIAATAISGVRQMKVSPVFWVVPLVIISGASVIHHYRYTNYRQDVDRDYWETFTRREMPIVRTLERYLEPGGYIFCEKEMYRYFVMPYIRAHALGAYKSMDYYQLSGPVADAMEADYHSLMSSESPAMIDSIMARYNIQTAVASFREFDEAPFKTLAGHWRTIYSDKYIAIYRRPS